ncbi:hypothetical protein NMG60_11013890 [Bertholletia excelsa]
MTELKREAEEDAGGKAPGGEDPGGELANIGSGATISSGFGGLGLAGIVGGKEDSEGAATAGVGKSGVTSGGKAGDGDEEGGYGRSAGPAEIVEVGKASEDGE